MCLSLPRLATSAITSGSYQHRQNYNTSKHALLADRRRAPRAGAPTASPAHGEGLPVFHEPRQRHHGDCSNVGSFSRDENDTDQLHGLPRSPRRFDPQATARRIRVLRQVSVDSLPQRLQIQAGGREPGLLVLPQFPLQRGGQSEVDLGSYYGFSSRFGPHENPQFDMLVGSNGYQFGDTTFTGISTHGGLADGCVTCHMQTRTPGNGSPTTA